MSFTVFVLLASVFARWRLWLALLPLPNLLAGGGAEDEGAKSSGSGLPPAR